MCKSQLEPIIENPGNMHAGAEQAFGRWLADGVYRGLIRLLRRLVIPTTRQNNTDKKLDFSTGRVFLPCEKFENTKLSILIKYILRGSA